MVVSWALDRRRRAPETRQPLAVVERVGLALPSGFGHRWEEVHGYKTRSSLPYRGQGPTRTYISSLLSYCAPGTMAKMETSSSNTSPALPILYDPSKHRHILSEIVDIHHDCVIQDGMPLSILDVSNRSKLDKYWLQRHAEVENGKRVIVLQFLVNEAGKEELVGLGSLHVPGEETGPFRSWIEKMMVSPRHRRKGFARRLMEKLEKVARERNAGLIVSKSGLLGEHCMLIQNQQLGTEVGTPAAQVYPRLGYKAIGVLPRYCISPKDGSLMDEIHFYKDLRDE